MVYNFVDRHWKVLLWIPIVILILSIVVVGSNIMSTGYFMERSVELSGGKVISVGVSSVDMPGLRGALPYGKVHFISGITNTLQVEIPFDADETIVLDEINKYADVVGEHSIRAVGPTLGDVFFNQAQIAIIVAFIFMAIVVFILFRSFVPSSIVILAAGTDILFAIAVSSLLGVELSFPVLAALLTLIGYSVDTDILLTHELLKASKENVSAGIKRAAKTGLTMSITTLVVLFALYFVSGSFVLEQIAFVLIIGIIIDIPATWFTNAGVLRWWIEKKEKKHEQLE